MIKNLKIRKELINYLIIKKRTLIKKKENILNK